MGRSTRSGCGGAARCPCPPTSTGPRSPTWFTSCNRRCCWMTRTLSNRSTPMCTAPGRRWLRARRSIKAASSPIPPAQRSRPSGTRRRRYRTRTGWFWHAAENASFLPLNQLIDIYYNSVGRNSLLRLNLSPDNRGLLFEGDVAMMNQFGAAITGIYQTNVAARQPATADSVFMNLPTYAAAMAVDGKLDTYWAAADNTTPVRLEIDLGGPRMFNVVSIQEPI